MKSQFQKLVPWHSGMGEGMPSTMWMGLTLTIGDVFMWIRFVQHTTYERTVQVL